jgi:CheY-like chemotaxis protein
MRPTLTANGTAALQALQQAAEAGEPFPLVLIDVHMPEMDGYALAERIRELPEHAGATLIMLSSGGQPGDGQRRRAAGIAACLTKPVKQRDLWKAIMSALGMPLPQDEPAILVEEERPSESRRLRILLAEDNLVNQKLAVRLLQRRGHSVVIAGNGREALAELRTRRFDVVLMDVQMPEMDGFAATAAIRDHERHTGKHIPIVAMTAYAMKGDRERCLQAGMDRYVCKPIRAQELFDTVEGVVTQACPVKAAAAVDLPAVSSTLDTAAALARVGDDLELLQELAGVFLDECPRLMLELRTAAASADAARVKAAAHGIKGAVDNFGAKPAFEAALRLETLGRIGDLAGVEEALQNLEGEIERLKPALTSLALSGMPCGLSVASSSAR